MKVLAAFLLVFAASTAMADGGCSESFPNGYKIKRSERLPSSWLTLGDHIVIDRPHHDATAKALKAYFPARADFFCVHANGAYIQVSNDDEYGPSFDFSATAPKCSKCSTLKEPDNTLVPKVGLMLGQSKADVAALLGIKFDADIVEVSFEEVEKGARGDILHIQKLRLEFRSNKLTRFGVTDYREAA